MTDMHEPIGPDPLTDPARPSSSGAEDTDEDAIGVDPLEAGMDPAEHWSSVTQSRHDDLDDGEATLDERLAAEEPEVPVATPNDSGPNEFT